MSEKDNENTQGCTIVKERPRYKINANLPFDFVEVEDVEVIPVDELEVISNDIDED